MRMRMFDVPNHSYKNNRSEALGPCPDAGAVQAHATWRIRHAFASPSPPPPPPQDPQSKNPSRASDLIAAEGREILRSSVRRAVGHLGPLVPCGREWTACEEQHFMFETHMSTSHQQGVGGVKSSRHACSIKVIPSGKTMPGTPPNSSYLPRRSLGPPLGEKSMRILRRKTNLRLS